MVRGITWSLYKIWTLEARSRKIRGKRVWTCGWVRVRSVGVGEAGRERGSCLSREGKAGPQHKEKPEPRGMLEKAKAVKRESLRDRNCREPTQARRLPFLNKSYWHTPYLCEPVLPVAVCTLVGDKKL